MQYQLLVFTVLIATALSGVQAPTCTPAWNQFYDEDGLDCRYCNQAAHSTLIALGCASCSYHVNPKIADCKTCLPGYYLDKTTSPPIGCAKCITGCRACTDSSTCTLCFQGYYLSSGKCQSCQNTNCPNNDKCCTSATDSCSSCSASTSTSSGTSINVKKSWSNLSILSIFALMSIIILLF